MNFKEACKIFSKGDMVIIKENLNKTDIEFSVTDTMRKMIGKQYRISNMGETNVRSELGLERVPYVYAAGYQWHPNDLHVIESFDKGDLSTDMGQKGSFNFNPSHLFNEEIK